MLTQTILEIPFQAPESVFAAFAADTGAIFLDSSAPGHPRGRYSFVAFEPLDMLVTVDEIPEALRGYTPAPNPPLPFTGGLAGFFSYDLARTLEDIPETASAADDFPSLRLGIYDQVIGFDHQLNRAWYCCYSDTQFDAAQRWTSLKRRIDAAEPPPPNHLRVTLSPVKSREDYTKDIQKVIDYIHAGDVFQVNLAQRFEGPKPNHFDPYSHYLTLRRMNPAPFSAYLNFGDTVIASSSPERFLNISGTSIEARPIKGTSTDPDLLAASTKDRAENIMIVDLLRNDLSKVCTDTSVDVQELCQIESYAGLHHLVSSVTGTLRPDITAAEALLSCFPGGSITGAPKIRAMEIIEELEPTRRGPYCGAIGYIGFNGTMDMNIAIRTIIYQGGKSIYYAGGGITGESDPQSEYDETMLKTQKIFESYS